MKRLILTLCVLIIGLSTQADEPTPNMRPSTPNVPSQVQSSGSDYLPNVIKQHEDLIQTQTQEENDDEYEYVEEDTEVEGETSTQPENNANKDNNIQPTSNNAPDKQEQEKVLDNEINPINTDATEENIKNNNYIPATNTETTKTNQKVQRTKPKKEKGEKPKYGNYRDADTDPYIQSWEEELKNENANSTTANFENVQKEKKTYTQEDYEQAYRDMKVPEFSYVHGVDPDQYYDMKDTSWSPYPLLRLNSPLYFKTITITPGYYLLTPRKYKSDWYILFKEAGVVKYTIPVFLKDYTPAFYYRDNLKELNMKKSQRWQIKFLNAWGKYIRKSKRRPAIQTNVELTDLDNNFLLMDLYYGANKYSIILRIEKY